MLFAGDSRTSALAWLLPFGWESSSAADRQTPGEGLPCRQDVTHQGSPKPFSMASKSTLQPQERDKAVVHKGAASSSSHSADEGVKCGHFIHCRALKAIKQ